MIDTVPNVAPSIALKDADRIDPETDIAALLAVPDNPGTDRLGVTTSIGNGAPVVMPTDPFDCMIDVGVKARPSTLPIAAAETCESVPIELIEALAPAPSPVPRTVTVALGLEMLPKDSPED